MSYERSVENCFQTYINEIVEYRKSINEIRPKCNREIVNTLFNQIINSKFIFKNIENDFKLFCKLMTYLIISENLTPKTSTKTNPSKITKIISNESSNGSSIVDSIVDSVVDLNEISVASSIASNVNSVVDLNGNSSVISVNPSKINENSSVSSNEISVTSSVSSSIVSNGSSSVASGVTSNENSATSTKTSETITHPNTTTSTSKVTPSTHPVNRQPRRKSKSRKSNAINKFNKLTPSTRFINYYLDSVWSDKQNSVNNKIHFYLNIVYLHGIDRNICYTLIDNIGLFETKFDLSQYNSIILNSNVYSIDKEFYTDNRCDTISSMYFGNTDLRNELFISSTVTTILFKNRDLNLESYLNDIVLEYPYLVKCYTEMKDLNIRLFQKCNPYGVISIIDPITNQVITKIIKRKSFNELTSHFDSECNKETNRINALISLISATKSATKLTNINTIYLNFDIIKRFFTLLSSMRERISIEFQTVKNTNDNLKRIMKKIHSSVNAIKDKTDKFNSEIKDILNI